MVCSLRRLHVDDGSVIHVLSLADGSQRLDAERRRYLVLETPFQSVVFFLNTRHRDISERVGIVIVELLPLSSVVYMAEITTDVGLEFRTLILQACLTREYSLVSQVQHKVVVDFRRNKCCRGRRSTELKAQTCVPSQTVFLDGIRTDTPFHAAIQELTDFALAVRSNSVALRYSDTVLHLTVALHGNTTNATGEERLVVIPIPLQRAPELSLAYVKIVVVTVFVAFLQNGVLVPQVVIDVGIANRVSTQRVSIDVAQTIRTEHIVNLLVVLTDIGCQLQTQIQCCIRAELSVQRRSQRQIDIVVVSGRYEI